MTTDQFQVLFVPICCCIMDGTVALTVPQSWIGPTVK